MINVKKIFIIPFGVCIMGSVAVEASMLDQVIYNVVGQVSNATGARLGDEIYYGSSKGTTHKHRTHRKRKKHVTHHVIHQDTPEMQIQKALASLGFYRGRIDGLVNSYETRSAIKAMNIAYNLGNTSSLAPTTKDSLIYLGTLFSFDRCLASQANDKRTKGKKIQTSLKIHGFYFTRIDGSIGKGTRRCIADYKMAKGLSSGSSLDFEEEYQLISTAKELNDRNIDGTINGLKNTYPQRQAMSQGQTGQYNNAKSSGYVPQGQMQAQQYAQPHNNLPQRQMQTSRYSQQQNTMNQGQMQVVQPQQLQGQVYKRVQPSKLQGEVAKQAEMSQTHPSPITPLATQQTATVPANTPQTLAQ